ncbi:lsu ribosomal protein l21p, putative [Ichthyophthirius multifiliis]|uniref:Large ribosomal subunit protein bL21m n=1 Tax=Ichthyophthirius multifiliis TaxID=5932 RepID=G0QTJ8_ICHMU|nr:lsu ribosomal protein l21p, putative [Ichthyophthirius multifiliis]EGR31449.1 lsu ribosomal protein l21p, putative [Ichthyophthirius multifiliis]|eukprot:XP_004034935.1 lsu ribosomal protein l21p, putative [Ichthyophthirius multifiliis]
MDKKYVRIRNEWQKALQKKAHRRERIKEIKATRPEIQPENQKLVIHQPLKGIQYPAKDDEIFAVVEILGFQYKVLQDDMLTVDWLKEYDINQQIIFDKVLAIGTTDYTAIGRPYISTAKVQYIYLYILKKNIFNEKRSMQLQNNKLRHRTMMTVLRVDKVEHILDESILQKAVGL